LIDSLRGHPTRLQAFPHFTGDPRSDDDFQLALHVAYELHYRSFRGVADEWEWHPSLIAYTAALESRFERALRADAGALSADDDVAEALPRLIRDHEGPSLSSYVLESGTLREVRELAVHRSAYQLKEADPHTWAIPRLAHGTKAALVLIQSDEYGSGVDAAMHSSLFAATMQALGLDSTYSAYVDVLPGTTLATGNLVTMFGLHRRLRGALVGHLAVFEMTSVIPMARYSQTLRRLGLGPAARRFYDVHVQADAHHEVVALQDLAASLARQEPALTADILFGARALMDVECRLANHLLSSWHAGRSSLLAPTALASSA
jgi:hypothetical protein